MRIIIIIIIIIIIRKKKKKKKNRKVMVVNWPISEGIQRRELEFRSLFLLVLFVFVVFVCFCSLISIKRRFSLLKVIILIINKYICI